MSPTEAAKIMATLSAAFVHNVDQAEAEIWFESVLREMDAELAGATTKRLIGEDQFWPKPARFSEVARAIKRGQEQPALPSADRPASPEVALQQIARAREVLREART